MSYIINGPTTIGDSGSLNTINGNVTLADITSAEGDIVYADSSNNLVKLAASTNGYFLKTNGAGTAPTWSSLGMVPDESCSVTKVTGDTFSNTPSAVANWSAGTAGSYNTGSLNLGTGVFTAGASGKYRFDCTIVYDNTGANANTGSRTIEIYDESNTTAMRTVVEQPNPDNGISKSLHVSADLLLVGSDEYSIRFYRSNAGTTNTISVNSMLSIKRIE